MNANFQLFGKLKVAGAVQAAAAPTDDDGSETVDGYTFTLHGAQTLKAIQAKLVTVDVTGPDREAREVPALVRRARPRDLLPPGQPRLLPHPRLRPGRERLHERARAGQGHGQLDDAREAQRRRPRPRAGKWRLFLQRKVDGKVLTVPFVLDVR